MATTTRIFLDASAIAAGIWSERGAGRMLLRLGEAGAIELLTTGLALRELERALRELAPEALGALALLLDRAGFDLLEPPAEERLAAVRRLVDHPDEALTLAAALGGQVHYLVTLSQQRFLKNPELPAELPFPIGTPGECLEWIGRRFRRMAAPGRQGRPG